MNHVIEHCGNFSPDVLEGMIGYGREVDKGRGKMGGRNQLPPSDGYATREADILLGGFIQRHAAQQATHKGGSLAKMDVQAQERLACRLAREHLEKYGPSGNEHYAHWMVRAQAVAKRHGIELPSRADRITDHEYFRTVRKWVKQQPDKGFATSQVEWPDLKRAAGTHLVLSPDPKIWQAIRSAGLDERRFLKTVATQTMKEFSDWRRHQVGTGHSLGWVAGTHVRDNGADRHPHVHLVVLKRDEAGKEVDWSVSCLKGRQGRADPDPMKELKRVFGKNVEKHLERMVGKENVPSKENACVAEATPPSRRCDRSREDPPRAQNHVSQPSLSLRSLGRGLRRIEYAMRLASPSRSRDPAAMMAREIGAMMRFVVVVGSGIERYMEARKRGRETPQMNSKVAALREFIRHRSYGYHPPQSRDHGPDLEPDF